MSERYSEVATAGEGSVKALVAVVALVRWQVWSLPSFEQVHEFRSEEQPQATARWPHQV